MKSNFNTEVYTIIIMVKNRLATDNINNINGDMCCFSFVLNDR